jgi:hypothetical protein
MEPLKTWLHLNNVPLVLPVTTVLMGLSPLSALLRTSVVAAKELPPHSMMCHTSATTLQASWSIWIAKTEDNVHLGITVTLVPLNPSHARTQLSDWICTVVVLMIVVLVLLDTFVMMEIPCHSLAIQDTIALSDRVVLLVLPGGTIQNY